MPKKKLPVCSRDSVPPRPSFLYKTRWCQLFLAGRCDYGDRCFYVHADHEMRVAPDLRKTSLCQSYRLQGSCEKGKDCEFAHGESDLKSKSLMCKFVGNCSKGAKCRWAHSLEELFENSKTGGQEVAAELQRLVEQYCRMYSSAGREDPQCIPETRSPSHRHS